MKAEEYIASGILELYVYGALSDEESREVSRELKKYPEIKEEVEEIENALEQLSAATAPYNPEQTLQTLRQKIESKQVRHLPHQKKTRRPWVAYIGWAASILLLIGLFTLIKDNNDLRKKLNKSHAESASIENKLNKVENKAASIEEMLAVIREKNTKKVNLSGQEKVAPGAYAHAFFNADKEKMVIDAKGLPDPPEGKVYQVWSLTFDPLKPTNIGLLKDFNKNDTKMFKLANANNSQGFGITLEPAGGSKTPTMNQLYTLGKVES